MLVPKPTLAQVFSIVTLGLNSILRYYYNMSVERDGLIVSIETE